MLERSDLPGGGVIVNISSIAAVTAMGSNVAYCASKAALDNMTRSLARALAPRIRVLSVSPGLVDTDFIKSLEPAWRDEQAARTPLRRLAQPAGSCPRRGCRRHTTDIYYRFDHRGGRWSSAR